MANRVKIPFEDSLAPVMHGGREGVNLQKRVRTSFWRRPLSQWTKGSVAGFQAVSAKNELPIFFKKRIIYPEWRYPEDVIDLTRTSNLEVTGVIRYYRNLRRRPRRANLLA